MPKYIHHHRFSMPCDNACVITFPNDSWAFDQGPDGVYINHITHHFITVPSSNKRLSTWREQSLWSVSLMADCQAVCGQNIVWLIWLLSNKVLCQCVTKKLRLLLLCGWANTHDMNRNEPLNLLYAKSRIYKDVHWQANITLETENTKRPIYRN